MLRFVENYFFKQLQLIETSPNFALPVGTNKTGLQRDFS